MDHADQLDLLKLLLEVNSVGDPGRLCEQLYEHGVTTLSHFAALREGTLEEWDVAYYYVYSALSHARELLRDSSHDLAAIRQELLVRARMHYMYVCTIAE